jgi:hypothetical protein
MGSRFGSRCACADNESQPSERARVFRAFEDPGPGAANSNGPITIDGPITIA